VPETSSWRHHLVQAQIARSRALREYLRVLRGQEFSTDLPLGLIEFFDSANDGFLERLVSLLDDPDFESLSDEAAEVHLVRYSVLYKFLFRITGDLEHFEGSRTIVEFSGPLQRFLVPGFSEVRLILHALPEVNYSWADLVGALTLIARELDVPIEKGPPAPQVWSLGFPGLQHGQTLMHTLLSHEVGHGVVRETSMVRPLSRCVKIESKRLSAALSGLTLPKELRSSMRQSLRRHINSVLGDWLEELACDVIGYELTGPAFLIASIHFHPVLSELDSPSAHYPSVRLRLALLFHLLKADLNCPPDSVCSIKTYKNAFFEEDTAAFLNAWDERVLLNKPVYGNSPLDIASEGIEGAFQDLVKVIQDKTRNLQRYNFMAHREHIGQLLERFKLLVPPNELDNPAGEADPGCILNAGWISYLSHVESLGIQLGWDEWKTRAKIEELVAKGLELHEVQRRWSEVSDG
jgi:hypothetical protein